MPGTVARSYPLENDAGSQYIQVPSQKTIVMPTKKAKERARADARQGKRPTTQAGEFVREEMHRLKKGSGNVRSRQQAIAIGLSEARRAGVKLGVPPKGKTSSSNRKKAAHDLERARGRAKPTPARSRGARKAARTCEKLFEHFAAARSAVAACFHAVFHVPDELAFFGAGFAGLGTGPTDRRMTQRVPRQEIGRGLANLRTTVQQA
jgi:hypothetical protein